MVLQFAVLAMAACSGMAIVPLCSFTKVPQHKMDDSMSGEMGNQSLSLVYNMTFRLHDFTLVLFSPYLTKICM